jgi:2'-5' RNA ligase
MKLFTALELPAPIRSELAAFRPDAAPGIRPIAPEQMHITLNFIGDAEVGEVRRCLASVDAVRVPVSVGDVGTFRLNGGRAILYAGVHETPELLGLHSSCGEALAEAGIGLESRRYVPHVTFARLKSLADRRVIDEILRSNEGRDFGAFTAERFVLYSSVQQAHTHHYEVIDAWPLR